MSEATPDLHCPHCEGRLDPVEMPAGSGWDGQIHWVCFNDDCSYYREGWDWMWERYRVKSSYRFRILDRETGKSSPLPVWSDDAIRNLIVEERETS